MRHLMSGIDCAIAGDATAATAAPVAETFKKSRRFIKVFSVWRVFLNGAFFLNLQQACGDTRFLRSNRSAPAGPLTRKWRQQNATKAWLRCLNESRMGH
jgi:hypothetical protein